MSCDTQCTRSLLSYLSRINSGELNVEQQNLDAWGADLRKSIEAAIKPQEQRIYALVYAVLLRSPDTTSRVLTEDYGLGTGMPKEFALAFVTHTNSNTFCPTLIHSKQQLAESTVSIRPSVIEALKSLKCGGAK